MCECSPTGTVNLMGCRRTDARGSGLGTWMAMPERRHRRGSQTSAGARMKPRSMWGMAMSVMGLAFNASTQENIEYEVHDGRLYPSGRWMLSISYLLTATLQGRGQNERGLPGRSSIGAGGGVLPEAGRSINQAAARDG